MTGLRASASGGNAAPAEVDLKRIYDARPPSKRARTSSNCHTFSLGVFSEVR